MEKESYPTVRIPKTVCPDMKKGQTFTLKILDMDEDEYEVRYEKKKGEKEDAASVQSRYREATEPAQEAQY